MIGNPIKMFIEINQPDKIIKNIAGSLEEWGLDK
jgi:hypothetical protein